MPLQHLVDVLKKESHHPNEQEHCVQMRDYKPRDWLELGVTSPADQSILLCAFMGTLANQSHEDDIARQSFVSQNRSNCSAISTRQPPDSQHSELQKAAIRLDKKHAEASKKWRDKFVNELDDTLSITPEDLSEKLSKHCCELVHMRDYKPCDWLELGVTSLADQSILLQATTLDQRIRMYVSGSSQISQVSTQTQDAFPKDDYVDSLQDNPVPPAVGEDPSALQMDANLEDKEVTGKKTRGHTPQL
eukprot:scaffold31031_cov32-Attheya_sp.AAC.3